MTTHKSIEEIVEEFMNTYTERDDFNGKAAGAKYNRIMYARHWQPTDKLIDWLRTTLTLYASQVREEAVAREKQLKEIHTMELDAISCKSIEDFVIWRDYRKQRPKQAELTTLTPKT